MSPTATATGASSSSTARPARTSATGAHTDEPTSEAPVSTYDPDKPPAKQFRNVSCVRIAQGRPGLRVRSAERSHPGVQEGRHVREGSVRLEINARRGLRCGTSRSRTIRSSDSSTSPTAPIRRCGCSRRDTLDVVSSVGAGGRWPGHFYGVGNVAVDSKGNLYTGETYEGKRLQKFIFKGLAAVREASQ